MAARVAMRGTSHAHEPCARGMRMGNAHAGCARGMRIGPAHEPRAWRQARGAHALHQADSLKHARTNITDSSGRAVAFSRGGSGLNRPKEGDVP